ncbi:MAG: hypothetical protein WA395_08740 [Nitrososphaeraceae archaeon]
MSDNYGNNMTRQIILDLFARALRRVKGGVIDFDMKGKSADRIEIDK